MFVLSNIRGHVYKRDRSWHYIVTYYGVVLSHDWTNSYDVIVRQCRADVAAFRRVIESCGYRLNPSSWYQLIEEARINQ